MKTLTPTLAVNLSEFAYSSTKSKLEVPLTLAKHFLFNSKSSLQGISGTTAEHLLNHSTGFGHIGEGRNGGRFEGELVIAFRGTAGIADTLTDLHCGMTVGPNYKAVHAGFNRTFESIKPQLAAILSKVGSRPVHSINYR